MYDWCAAMSALLKSGMTQQELAQILECSQPYISQVLKKENVRVSYEMGVQILALCEKRGVDVEASLCEQEA